jgi:hypothetical protein
MTAGLAVGAGMTFNDEPEAGLGVMGAGLTFGVVGFGVGESKASRSRATGVDAVNIYNDEFRSTAE